MLQGEGGQLGASMGHPVEPPGKEALLGHVAGRKQGPC